MDELFTVEYESGGEPLDIDDNGGYSVFNSRTDAQDAIDSMSENVPMIVVRFVREAV